MTLTPGLILKRAADTFPAANWTRSDAHWCVLSGSDVVGSIKRVVGGPRDGLWLWTLTAVYPWNAGRHSGSSASLPEAQAAFKQAWLNEMASPEPNHDIAAVTRDR